MMEFAPTLPVELYPLLDHGRYHLVQAHHLIDASEDVINWFYERSQHQQHTVILDNGVMELGEPDTTALETAALMIEPNVIVCPDSFQDREGTLELFDRYIDDVVESCGVVMLVPQGKSVMEWCKCATQLILQAERIGMQYTIGVPKVLSTYAGGRWAALCWMQETWAWVGTHLLGTWSGMAEPVQMGMWFDNIIGFDTTLPIAMAKNRWLVARHLDKKTKLDNADWETAPDTIKEEVAWIAKINIASIRKLLERNVVAARSWTDLKHLGTDQTPEMQLPLPLGKHQVGTRPGRDDPS
jgi:hypothetical protein